MKYKLCCRVIAMQLSLSVDIHVLHCCRLQRYIVYLLPWWQSQENYMSPKNKWNKKKFKKFGKVRQLLPGSNVCQTPSCNWQGWSNLQFDAYQSFTRCGRMQLHPSSSLRKETQEKFAQGITLERIMDGNEDLFNFRSTNTTIELVRCRHYKSHIVLVTSHRILANL